MVNPGSGNIYRTEYPVYVGYEVERKLILFTDWVNNVHSVLRSCL